MGLEHLLKNIRKIIILSPTNDDYPFSILKSRHPNYDTNSHFDYDLLRKMLSFENYEILIKSKQINDKRLIISSFNLTHQIDKKDYNKCPYSMPLGVIKSIVIENPLFEVNSLFNSGDLRTAIESNYEILFKRRTPKERRTYAKKYKMEF